MRNLQKKKNLVVRVYGVKRNFHKTFIGEYTFNYEYEVLRFFKTYKLPTFTYQNWVAMTVDIFDETNDEWYGLSEIRK